MFDPVTQDDVFSLIAAELRRQDEKWGETRDINPHVWTTVLGEEIGEVNRAVLECNPEDLCRELVQVAAVSIAFVLGTKMFGEKYFRKDNDSNQLESE